MPRGPGRRKQENGFRPDFPRVPVVHLSFAMGEEKKGITGALSRHLKGMTRSTVESLAKKFGVMPSDRAWVAVDVGASLASVSLSVTSEFFKAAPEVAKYLENDDLRAWAELGRRIALNNPE